ncbi:AraC family transcriptional regulator [Mycolicibacterium moriokaense]|nr:AraC family transcriptional regulator [Mycolicibacterium moriokaense]
MAVADAGPRLLRPRQALAEHIEFFGYWQRGSGEPHRSRALPRGAVTVVIDVSGNQRVDFFAADGRTRLHVPPAFVAGAGTASYVTSIDASRAVVTVHFRPAGASAFLGLPLGELENACVGIDALWGSAGTVLHERLIDTPSAIGRIGLLESFLLHRMEVHRRPSHRAVMSVMAAMEQDPSMRISAAASMTGLSPRRLGAAFRTEVGLAPKAYQRVRRLQAALSKLDSATAAGAEIAADLGYFDQAHFVREFRSFTAMSPTQYARRRSGLPSHVDLSADPRTGPKYPSPPPGRRT